MTTDGRPIDEAAVRDALVAWHAEHGRDIPFRTTTDPWRILVLEVASQQTQLPRAVEGAAEFCRRFPSPAALAASTPADAIRAWAGMGYNRRAVGLHRAAVEIVRRHAGRVPDALVDLEALPGVGPYTARAVAAQAFGAPVAPLDVNVARVIGRLIGSPAGTAHPPRRPRLQALADALVDRRDPRRWVHAVMDLAALVCTARSPGCRECLLAAMCPSAFGTPPAAARPRTTTPGSAAFPSTRRWLRGQLVRELRAARAGEWIVLDGDRGPHDIHAVREAIASLGRDGLVEVSDSGLVRLAETRGG